MPANPDFKDLFSIFNAERVEYLVVGAHAVMFFSEPRFTKDLDIWINPTADNAARAYRALQRFGAPLTGVSENDFRDPAMIYQIGIEPNRIDVLMSIAGVSFPQAWQNKIVSTYDGVAIYLINKADLIAAKRASNRLQDQLDLEHLT